MPLGVGAGGLLRRCASLILGYPQSAGALLLAMLAMPAPIAPMGFAAFAFSARPGGLLLFLPMTAAAMGAAMFLGAAGAVAALHLTIARLRGERPGLGAGLKAALGHLARVAPWPFRLFDGPFVLAVLVAAEPDLTTASARASSFVESRPGALAAARPLHRLFSRCAALLLAFVAPITAGFCALPLLSFIGFSVQPLPMGIERYAAVWGLCALLFCLACAAAMLALACAAVHAACIYLYAAEGPAVRERIARLMPVETLGAEPAAPTPQQQQQQQPQQQQPQEQPSMSPPPQAASPELPALPAEPEYAREEMLPQAGRAASIESAFDAPPPPPPRPLEMGIALPDDRRPRSALAVYRSALILTTLFSIGWAIVYFDGPGIIARSRLLRKGAAARAVVRGIEPRPMLGSLFYQVSLEYPTAEGPRLASVFVGEGVRGRLQRGDTAAVHHDPERPGFLALDDDFGFAQVRAAQLLIVVGFLVVGGHVLVFRLPRSSGFPR